MKRGENADHSLTASGLSSADQVNPLPIPHTAAAIYAPESSTVALLRPGGWANLLCLESITNDDIKLIDPDSSLKWSGQSEHKVLQDIRSIYGQDSWFVSRNVLQWPKFIYSQKVKVEQYIIIVK